MSVFVPFFLLLAIYELKGELAVDIVQFAMTVSGQVQDWLRANYNNLPYKEIIVAFGPEAVAITAYLTLRLMIEGVARASLTLISLIWTGFSTIYTKQRKYYGKTYTAKYAMVYSNVLQLKKFFLVALVREILYLSDILVTGIITLMIINRFFNTAFNFDACAAILDYFKNMSTGQRSETAYIYEVGIYWVLLVLKSVFVQFLTLRPIIMILEYPDVCLVTLPTLYSIVLLYTVIKKKESDRIRMVTNVKTIIGTSEVRTESYNVWFVNYFAPNIYLFQKYYDRFIARGIFGGLVNLFHSIPTSRDTLPFRVAVYLCYPIFMIIYLPFGCFRAAFLILSIPVRIRVTKAMRENVPFWLADDLYRQFTFLGHRFNEDDGFVYNSSYSLVLLISIALHSIGLRTPFLLASIARFLKRIQRFLPKAIYPLDRFFYFIGYALDKILDVFERCCGTRPVDTLTLLPLTDTDDESESFDSDGDSGGDIIIDMSSYAQARTKPVPVALTKLELPIEGPVKTVEGRPTKVEVSTTKVTQQDEDYDRGYNEGDIRKVMDYAYYLNHYKKNGYTCKKLHINGDRDIVCEESGYLMDVCQGQRHKGHKVLLNYDDDYLSEKEVEPKIQYKIKTRVNNSVEPTVSAVVQNSSLPRPTVSENENSYHAVAPPATLLVTNEKVGKAPETEMPVQSYSYPITPFAEEFNVPQVGEFLELSDYSIQVADAKELPIKFAGTDWKGIHLIGKYNNAHHIPQVPLDYNYDFMYYMCSSNPKLYQELEKRIVVTVNSEREIKSLMRWRIRQEESVLDEMPGRHTGMTDSEWVIQGLRLWLGIMDRRFTIRDPRSISLDDYSKESLKHFPGRGPKLKGFNSKGEAYYDQKNYLIRHWSELRKGSIPYHEWAMIPVPKTKGTLKEFDYQYECRTAICPDLWFSHYGICLLGNFMKYVSETKSSPMYDFKPLHRGFDERVRRIIHSHSFYQARDTKDHGPSQGSDMYILLKRFFKRVLQSSDLDFSEIEDMIDSFFDEIEHSVVVTTKESGGYVFKVNSGWKDGMMYTSQIDALCALMMDLLNYKKVLDGQNDVCERLCNALNVNNPFDILKFYHFEVHGDNMLQCIPNVCAGTLDMRSGLPLWKKLGYTLKEMYQWNNIFEAELMSLKIDFIQDLNVYVPVRSEIDGLKCLSYPKKNLSFPLTRSDASYLLGICNCAIITERFNRATVAYIEAYRDRLITEFPGIMPDKEKLKTQYQQLGISQLEGENLPNFVSFEYATKLHLDVDSAFYSDRHGKSAEWVSGHLRRTLALLEAETQQLPVERLREV
jgi:hypothetical protein